MGYLTELRDQWRPLLAATIGLGSGFSLQMYTTSIMAPHFLEEFGWTRSEFALVGSLSLLMALVFPFVGRLTDLAGVRRTALIGVISLPLAYTALSAMNGDMRIYIALFLFQALFCITTTATVYSRIVVQYVKKARGLALAIVASGPAITGAIGGPLLNNFVEAHGWRQGFVALAIFTIVAGAIALLMMPPERKEEEAKPKARRAKGDYATIFRTPAFWIIGIAMLLCNLPQVIALTQLNLVLIENGVAPLAISGMIGAFATGVLVGRFPSGLALDRFAAPIVAFIGFALPSIGLFILASSLDAPAVLTAAVFMIGLSFGAEGDVVGILVVRYFGVKVYSSVMGLMTLAISTSASLGAALVSVMLDRTGTYTLFLTFCAFSVLFGSLMFLLLRKPPAERLAEQVVPQPSA